jgi:thiamine-monophosphate kinase
MTEAELIARIRELFSDRIGDDAAIVGGQVVTTDMLIEDIDFTRSTPLASIARKSLAVNLSDLAAMGAKPHFAVSAFGFPPWVLDRADEFLLALRDAARQYDIEIVGGDLSRSEKLVIAITAIGRAPARPLLRSGAKVNDRIYVSRPIGASAAGLLLLQKGWTVEGDAPVKNVGYAEVEFARSAIRRHIDPEPETELGMALAALPSVSACIDISDGLSTDLHHLCDASQCGAEIERERLPIFPDLLGSGIALGLKPQDCVLHGGEEYALLFTSPLRESELSAKLKRPVYAIGRITERKGVVLKEDGVARPLEPKGWDHFKM